MGECLPIKFNVSFNLGSKEGVQDVWRLACDKTFFISLLDIIIAPVPYPPCAHCGYYQPTFFLRSLSISAASLPTPSSGNWMGGRLRS